MLKISKSQMEALRLAMKTEFIRRTLAVLRDAVPSFLAGVDDVTALRRIENSVTKAESYGLTTEREIRDFIAVQAVAGEDFDCDPRFAAARAVLTDNTILPTDRLARARKHVVEVMARKEKG
jgi:hypothetical protein